MHQTTVRFGPDLWEALEEECRMLGVSVAQYVRDAALARLMYTAGRRGDSDFDRALEEAASPARDARSAVERAGRESSDASALQAQGLQARRRAEELRDASVARRDAAKQR